MVTFCIIHIGNIKLFLKHHPRVPTNPFASKCVLIFYIIYVKNQSELGGGERYPTAQNVMSGRARTLAFGFLMCSLENIFSSIMK